MSDHQDQPTRASRVSVEDILAGRLKPLAREDASEWAAWEHRTLSVHRGVLRWQPARASVPVEEIEQAVRERVRETFRVHWWRGFGFGALIELDTVPRDVDTLEATTDTRNRLKGCARTPSRRAERSRVTLRASKVVFPFPHGGVVMRLLPLSLALSVLAVPLSGCWSTYSSAAFTTTVGGVSFTVRRSDGGGGVSVTSSSSAAASTGSNGETDTETLTHRLSVGDISIELGEETDGAMPMTVNGTPHGTVRSGDAVVIDEDGVITVNGQVRTGE